MREFKTKPIVFVNGPPRSGKDEAGRVLKDEGWYEHKMVRPTEAALAAVLCLPDFSYWREEAKDEPLPGLGGASMRTAMIEFSERFMKPTFGADVFGVLAVRKLAMIETPTVISDSGFRYEAAPLVAANGASNCLLLRIHRPGKTFFGDSRSYIELADLGVTEIDIDNAGSLEEYRDRVTSAVGRYGAANGWPRYQRDIDRGRGSARG